MGAELKKAIFPLKTHCNNSITAEGEPSLFYNPIIQLCSHQPTSTHKAAHFYLLNKSSITEERAWSPQNENLQFIDLFFVAKSFPELQVPAVINGYSLFQRSKCTFPFLRALINEYNTLLIAQNKTLVSYLALELWILPCLQTIDETRCGGVPRKTLSPPSTPVFLKLPCHFAAESPDLFNPNDRGNWSAWAIALPQCRACVRTILENHAENSPFKQQRLLLMKWIHNSLKVIHSVRSLKALFHCCMAYQTDRRDKSKNRWTYW